jgi:hypothetical protein
MFYKPDDPIVLAMPPGPGYRNAVQYVTGQFSNCWYPFWGLKQYADNSPEHNAALRACTARITYRHYSFGMRLRSLVRLLQQQREMELHDAAPFLSVD